MVTPILQQMSFICNLYMLYSLYQLLSKSLSIYNDLLRIIELVMIEMVLIIWTLWVIIIWWCRYDTCSSSLLWFINHFVDDSNGCSRSLPLFHYHTKTWQSTSMPQLDTLRNSWMIRTKKMLINFNNENKYMANIQQLSIKSELKNNHLYPSL